VFILVVSPVQGVETRAKLLVLSYHDIPQDVNLDIYSVDRASFVQQIEYLRTHGYNFVSLEEVIQAQKSQGALPDKAVLLTFDDAYLSFYEFVYPVLKLYGYPCVLSVVTGWIDNQPKDILSPLMNWAQLKEVAQSKLVAVASHTHGLHADIIYNPYGNKSWAVASRQYDAQTKTYETDDMFQERIHKDLLVSKQVLREKLGTETVALTWPYGRYNALGIQEAKKSGFEVFFSLDDRIADIRMPVISRVAVINNPSIADFVKELKQDFIRPVQQRIVQADLDLIYDDDPAQVEKNLDKFVERIFAMKVSTVYLQAFCDDKGDGNIRCVYFPNRVLPMRLDLFNRVVNQLSIRGIQVYAWMPMLSIVLPDREETQALRVCSNKGGFIQPSESWYERLSPFSPRVRQKLLMLYEDMAANARISGVVFLDDGYLNDYEDFHPDAVVEYAKISKDPQVTFDKLSCEQKRAWTHVKTMKLIELTESLKEAVRRYRPEAGFARTLYAPVLLEPSSEEWYSQNYAESLKAYDYVVIMAYPMMEKDIHPVKWLKKLLNCARGYPAGLQKTVFKIQTHDWFGRKWLSTRTIIKWLRTLVTAGAKHIGYYPDNYLDDKPEAGQVRLMMSTEDFPYKRIYRVKDGLVIK